MTISLALTSPGAIPDLDTLKSVIADWLDRDDLEARIPTFIVLAEAQFNRELRTTEMERTVILSATAENTSLPDDYVAMRAIYVEGSPDRPLAAKSPTALRDEYSGATGVPDAYALVSNGIRLAPPPASQTLLSLDYFATIAALSVASPSNWLLEQHPGAYLYGVLFHAECFLDNAMRAAQWKGLLDEALDSIKRNSRNNRFGAGPLTPNTVYQVRGSRC